MPERVVVGSTDELPNDGDRFIVEVDEKPIAVFNIGGEFFCIDDVCTHDGGPVAEGDIYNSFEIECPRHGARFDIRTGKVLSFPAITDVAAYPLTIEDGEIIVELPD